MNRVQTVTQKQYRVEKLGRKPSHVHEHQHGPSLANRRAQARACLAVSWVLRPCRGLAARSCHGLHDRIAGASAPCRGRVRTQAQPYRGLPCDTLPASSSPSCRNTLYCIAMQFQPNQTAVIQYTVLQYNLLFAHLRPPCHDTLNVL